MGSDMPPPPEGAKPEMIQQQFAPGTGPGAGGEFVPGEYVPPAEPTEQQPTSFVFDSLLGTILMPFLQIFH